jgi:hypothetical protein
MKDNLEGYMLKTQTVVPPDETFVCNCDVHAASLSTYAHRLRLSKALSLAAASRLFISLFRMATTTRNPRMPATDEIGARPQRLNSKSPRQRPLPTVKGYQGLCTATTKTSDAVYRICAFRVKHGCFKDCQKLESLARQFILLYKSVILTFVHLG